MVDIQKTDELRELVPGRSWVVSVVERYSSDEKAVYKLQTEGVRGTLKFRASWDEVVECARQYMRDSID
jgi:hypothetical protein